MMEVSLAVWQKYYETFRHMKKVRSARYKAKIQEEGICNEFWID